MTTFVVHLGTTPAISTVSVLRNKGVTLPGLETYLRGFSGFIGVVVSIFTGIDQPL
jgi:hypothetical protein